MNGLIGDWLIGRQRGATPSNFFYREGREEREEMQRIKIE
jgi:hypothetical protein